MHYSLQQCKLLAKSLVHPENLDLSEMITINLEHELPWPSDHVVQEVLTYEKSKKKAAATLGLTRRCLRRRLKEIKETGRSTPPTVPWTVIAVLNRLLADQTIQQISAETEISQAWICRMMTNLFTARKQRYDLPDVRPRTPRPVPIPQPPATTRISLQSIRNVQARIRYQITANSSPWFGTADTSTTGAVSTQWINFSNNSFTSLYGDVTSDYGDEEAQTETDQAGSTPDASTGAA